MMGGIVHHPNMLICDSCNRMFSVKSIVIVAEKPEEGYEARWFYCPFCGHRYLVSFTDHEQRKRLELKKRVLMQIQAGLRKGFRRSTINGYYKRLDKLKAEINQNGAALNQAGKSWLSGGDWKAELERDE